MLAGDMDPVVMVGGTVAPMAGGAHVGEGEWAVVEVDESDGGFTHTTPSVAILTNLEAEHTDHYGNFAGLCAAFSPARRFRKRLHYMPHPRLPEAALQGIAAPIHRVGLSDGDTHAQKYQLEADGSRCELIINGEKLR